MSTRTPKKIAEMSKEMPTVYKELEQTALRLISRVLRFVRNVEYGF